MSTAASFQLHQRRVVFVGKLGGMTRRQAAQLVRDHGGIPVDRQQAEVDLIVIGAEQSPMTDIDQLLHEHWLSGVERGNIEMIQETELYARLGLVELEQNIRRLYTPAMLADLLHVPVRNIRRWHRLGLITPVRVVHRLPYFDFQEVSSARQMASLLASGARVASIRKTLADAARWLPGGERSLAQLRIIVEGKRLFLRQDEGLLEPGGQYRIDFDSLEMDAHSVAQRRGEPESPEILEMPCARLAPLTMALSDMVQHAHAAEDEDRMDDAVEWYRVAMARFGPSADLHFQLAELLYRVGEVQAARERYFAAIEMDEDFVEARANLGCVLVETGQPDWAVAAFQGALARHDAYADVHYHLARTLDDLGRIEDAKAHWHRFVQLAPDSPWAEEARSHLEATT
jgi:tetratricopeptide (TPR) repeat protein